MAKYDDAYFENLTKEANVIYRCLYLNEIKEIYNNNFVYSFYKKI